MTADDIAWPRQRIASYAFDIAGEGDACKEASATHSDGLPDADGHLRSEADESCVTAGAFCVMFPGAMPVR